MLVQLLVHDVTTLECYVLSMVKIMKVLNSENLVLVVNYTLLFVFVMENGSVPSRHDNLKRVVEHLHPEPNPHYYALVLNDIRNIKSISEKIPWKATS